MAVKYKNADGTITNTIQADSIIKITDNPGAKGDVSTSLPAEGQLFWLGSSNDPNPQLAVRQGTGYIVIGLENPEKGNNASNIAKFLSASGLSREDIPLFSTDISGPDLARGLVKAGTNTDINFFIKFAPSTSQNLTTGAQAEGATNVGSTTSALNPNSPENVLARQTAAANFGSTGDTTVQAAAGKTGTTPAKGFVYGEDILDKKANDAAVNTLYNAYFGRDANAAELQNWGAGGGPDTTVRALEEFLKKERIKFNFTEPVKTLDEIRGGTTIPPETDSTGAPIPGTGTTPGSPNASQISLPNDITEILAGGGNVLIKFDTDPDGAGPQNTSTVFLADPDNQTLRPFLNQEALDKYLSDRGLSIDKVNIYNAPIELLSNGLAFSGYDHLSNDQGINTDGQIPVNPDAATNGDEISEDRLTNLYGNEYSPEATEFGYGMVTKLLERVFKGDPNISDDILNKVLGNDKIMALYTGALTYGGYTPTDIYRDLRRRQLAQDGDASMQNLIVIDDVKDAQSYYSSGAGATIKSNPALSVPGFLGDIESSLFDFDIFNLPDEVFQILVPPIDWTTPEAQAEAEKIKAAYFDILTEILEAQTEQAKTIADDNFEQFREDLDRTYGLKISDNAIEGWNQLLTLTSQFGQRGLEGSGFQRETMDRFLQNVRRQDEQLRTEKLSIEDEAERERLLKSASPDEIKAFIAANPDRAQKMGLIPSSEVANSLSIESLTAQLKESYPDIPDNIIALMAANYRSIVLDNDGNYLSELYQNLFSNRANIALDKLGAQFDVVFNTALDEEKQAFKEFTKGDPFSSAGITDISDIPQAPTPTVPTTPTPAVPTPTVPTPTVPKTPAELSAENPFFGTPAGDFNTLEEAQAFQDQKNQTTQPVTSTTPTSTTPTIEQQNASAPAGWEIDPATGRLRKILT